jgi:hypothetical protein
MGWSDKFSKLVEKKIQLQPGKEWRFALEEHKKKGTMHINIRQFKVAQKEGDYEGPTKQGFIMQINSLDDLDKIENIFDEYFDEVKELL